ncbi:MAG: sigma 54-interacting transcriptional regulator [Acidobacteria bacterium]|nr:sigma 54-interacting transcriptional regulator [Acidobacteriota bacterium]
MTEGSPVIGQGSQMQRVLHQVQRLGKYRWPVLLLGETGTGKEMIARALHEVDPRGPFVTIDCSSMVGTLMESELFGHAKGAFTGAVTQKTGLIEMAHGGTAFFDEIGELPLDLQAKLLRVLQEKEFRPVGALNHRRADFRIIAATNRDLQREVEKGTFRRDLYYRLNVVGLRLPPLRDRMEDIPTLVDYFIKRYGRGHEIAAETLGVLCRYPWPGNVRELENCIKHMVTVNSGPILHDADLPSGLQNHLHAESVRGRTMAMAVGQHGPLSLGGPMLVPPVQTAPNTGAGGSVVPFALSSSAGDPSSTLSGPTPIPPGYASTHNNEPILTLAEMEKRHIIRALGYTRGDRVAAAALLGIGRTTLYRKLREYKLAM